MAKQVKDGEVVAQPMPVIDVSEYREGYTPTVRVVDAECEGGFKTINASDFVEGEHTAFVEQSAA